MPGSAVRWVPRWAGVGGGFLSLQGVERAAVGAVVALKVMNILQMCVTLFFTRTSSRPWLEFTAAGAYVASGVIVLTTALRAQRLSRPAVELDVVVAFAVLAVAPLFQPSDPTTQWTDWPVFVSFLAAAEACACLSAVRAVTSTVAVMTAAASWLLFGAPPPTRHLIYSSLVPYVGFAAVSFVFLYYLRRLAALADERARTIRMLEEEHTRRVLHTPYRLLNDLAGMLRNEAVRDGDRPDRKARLAEAVASVREIETIVRGTEPASSNLAADLQRLHDQFADLPLIMNVDDAGTSLPPQAVYRLREAVRSALQNVRLHAQATEVVVYCTTDPTSWLVSVHDNGRGFDSARRRGTGLNDIIVSALEEIGAQVNIESAPGEGTLIEITGDYQWKTDPARASSSSTIKP